MVHSGTRTLFQVKVYDLPSFFSALDKDGSGLLDIAEIVRGLKRMDVSVSKREINELVSMFDDDGNGKIDLPELVRAFNAVTELYEVGIETPVAGRSHDLTWP